MEVHKARRYEGANQKKNQKKDSTAQKLREEVSFIIYYKST